MEKNFTDFQDTIPDNGKDMTLDAELEAYFESLDDGTVDLAEARKALAAINAAIPDKVNHRRAGRAFRFVTVAAASMFLPLLVYTCHLAFRSEPQQSWIEKYVPVGETEEMILSDGTKLSLNAGSRITYPDFFAGDQRRIFIDGEVYAEVAKNEECPFIIESGNVEVKVLGTTFCFKSYHDDDYSELMLLEGSVKLKADADSIIHEAIIHPGELANFDKLSGDFNIRKVDGTSYRPFTENRSLHFLNTRLSDVAKELERQFGVRFVIADDKLASTHYYAYFTNGESLDEILLALNSDNKMKIRRTPEAIYILKN